MPPGPRDEAATTGLTLLVQLTLAEHRHDIVLAAQSAAGQTRRCRGVQRAKRGQDRCFLGRQVPGEKPAILLLLLWLLLSLLWVPARLPGLPKTVGIESIGETTLLAATQAVGTTEVTVEGGLGGIGLEASSKSRIRKG